LWLCLVHEDAEVRGITRSPKTASSRAAASSNMFILPPDDLSSMLNPPEKDSHQDSATVAGQKKLQGKFEFFDRQNKEG
jgi:hypothetical protein